MKFKRIRERDKTSELNTIVVELQLSPELKDELYHQGIYSMEAVVDFENNTIILEGSIFRGWTDLGREG